MNENVQIPKYPLSSLNKYINLEHFCSINNKIKFKKTEHISAYKDRCYLHNIFLYFFTHISTKINAPYTKFENKKNFKNLIYKKGTLQIFLILYVKYFGAINQIDSAKKKRWMQEGIT